MSERAKVLYKFDGLSENGEICLYEGEVITVINKNIGEGWWEGQASGGRVGLFPEAYVELIAQNGNTSNTPRYSTVPGEDYEQQLNYNQSQPSPVSSPVNNFNQPPISPVVQNDEYSQNNYNSGQNYNDDDAWSEDWDDSSTVATTVIQQPTPVFFGANKRYGSEAQDVSSINSVDSRSSKVSGTVSKNFNRFSSFVKHGGESYMLGKADARVRQIDQINIEMEEDGPVWRENQHKFTCTIDHPKQQSKMKGLKKFVCYNLMPSDTDVTVQRRYKHFDWLYVRLVERYPMVAVPKLPDKQASGRFEEDFIEARMARLKLWVSYICRHPVLSKSQLFRNFLTLTEQKAWKMSKRQAEKDDLALANFFLTVSLPPAVTTVTDSDGPLDQFKKFTKAMDDGISQFSVSATSLSNKQMGIIKREYQSFGKSICAIAAGFNMHQTTENKTLTNALKSAGQSYQKVGDMFANQPKEDLHNITDTMWLYKGMLDTFPDVWHIQTGAVRKVKECKKLKEENKMNDVELGAVTERADRVVCCMRAEIAHFHKERIRDFALAHKHLLQKQADFFDSVAQELRTALTSFDEMSYES